jgi:hypothetical protein
MANRPATAIEAATAITRLLGSQKDACPGAFVERWQVHCGHGDVDGDGKPDDVYLVPLDPTGKLVPHPAAVVVRRSSSTALESFPRSAEAESSLLGLTVFDVADHTGDSQPEIAYLVSRCGARGCVTHIEIQSWDGTAWRDIGPGDGGVDNVAGVVLEGQGPETVYVLHGGHLDAPGAGPSRTGTFRYAFNGSRYTLASTVWDAPQYLFHAILEADALFEEKGDFAGAIVGYKAAIDDASLKDWKAEANPARGGALPSGREQLIGYALFRIAIATAATGQDPTLALDAVIARSQEPLFVSAAEAFRRGFLEVGTVRAGCLEVTRYLTLPDAATYLADVFDYGYANPRKAPSDICPL